jgi:hypothetical protein
VSHAIAGLLASGDLSTPAVAKAAMDALVALVSAAHVSSALPLGDGEGSISDNKNLLGALAEGDEDSEGDGELLDKDMDGGPEEGADEYNGDDDEAIVAAAVAAAVSLLVFSIVPRLKVRAFVGTLAYLYTMLQLSAKSTDRLNIELLFFTYLFIVYILAGLGAALERGVQSRVLLQRGHGRNRVGGA